MSAGELLTLVFVAYAETDLEVARQVAAALEARGLSCFLAGRDIGATTTGEWMRALDAALSRAQAMVVVVSDASLGSTWVGDEVGYFRARARRGEVSTESPIPFRVSGPPADQWPPTWQFVQHVDATQPSNWERALTELADRVESLLARREGREGPAPELPSSAPSAERRWLRIVRAFGLVLVGMVLGYPLSGVWAALREPPPNAGIGPAGLTPEVVERLRGISLLEFRARLDDRALVEEAGTGPQKAPLSSARNTP